MPTCGVYLPTPWGLKLGAPDPVSERAMEEVQRRRGLCRLSRCVLPIRPQVKSVRRRDKKASVLFIEGNMDPKGRGLVSDWVGWFTVVPLTRAADTVQCPQHHLVPQPYD